MNEVTSMKIGELLIVMADVIDKKERLLPINTKRKEEPALKVPEPRQIKESKVNKIAVSEVERMSQQVFVENFLDGRVKFWKTKPKYIKMAEDVYENGTSCFKDNVLLYKIAGVQKLHNIVMASHKVQNKYCSWFAAYKLDNDNKNPNVRHIDTWCSANLEDTK